MRLGVALWFLGLSLLLYWPEVLFGIVLTACVIGMVTLLQVLARDYLEGRR